MQERRASREIQGRMRIDISLTPVLRQSPALRSPALLRLAGPLVVSFWLRSTFAWVDTIYASMLPEGDASIAAIGLTLPLEFLALACWVGTSNGLTARLASAMGAGEGASILGLQLGARKIIHILCVSFLLLAAGVWWVIPHLGLDPAVAGAFRIYAPILLAGSGLTSFWAILPDSVVKAHQDTKGTMWAGIISGCLNVILNTVFVFVCGWGIMGIALSTVIGRLGGLTFAIFRARGHELARIARNHDSQPGIFENPVRAILQLAVPGALAYFFISGETLAVNLVLAQSEDATPLLASWSIFDRTVRFLAMPIIAASVALLPLVARLHGKNDFPGIRMELRVGLRAGFFYVLILVLPVALLVGPWVAEKLADAETTRLFAAQGMAFIPLTVLALLPIFLVRSAFEGLQQPRPGLVASFVRATFLVVPLVALGWAWAPHFGYSTLQGACAGYLVGQAAASLGLGLWMRSRLNREADGVPV